MRDVILSGGDPLSLRDDKLESILAAVRAIEHVVIIRLGTRNPVAMPQRITTESAHMLGQYAPLFVITHFNHPRECTREAYDACVRLVKQGLVLCNQMVLLKGISDNADFVLKLNHRLLQMRAHPYYMLHCDMAAGVSRFRASIPTGVDIIDTLRVWTSDLAVPHYVVDLPGGGGKVAFVPSNVIHDGMDGMRIRNYRN